MTTTRPPTPIASMAAGQRAAQHRQLVVDLDAQRLEGALGRVAAGAARRRPGSRRRAARRAAPSAVNGSLARSRTTASAIRRANFSSPYWSQDPGELLDGVAR